MTDPTKVNRMLGMRPDKQKDKDDEEITWHCPRTGRPVTVKMADFEEALKGIKIGQWFDPVERYGMAE